MGQEAVVVGVGVVLLLGERRRSGGHLMLTWLDTLVVSKKYEIKICPLSVAKNGEIQSASRRSPRAVHRIGGAAASHPHQQSNSHVMKRNVHV